MQIGSLSWQYFSDKVSTNPHPDILDQGQKKGSVSTVLGHFATYASVNTITTANTAYYEVQVVYGVQIQLARRQGLTSCNLDQQYPPGPLNPNNNKTQGSRPFHKYQSKHQVILNEVAYVVENPKIIEREKTK